MKKIALVAVFVALLAAPAFAEVQNIKLSGSLNLIGLQRNDFDLGLNSGIDEDQNVAITQTILSVNADLTDQVSATIGLLNERAWGVEDSTNMGLDVYLAYITLREFLYSPLTIVAGKQSFHYGNSFIVDSAGTNNSAPSSSGLAAVAGDLTAQTTQDAIRAILDYDPLVLEFLWSKITEGNATFATTSTVNDDDTDLYGANATYNFGDERNTQVEAYFFGQINGEDPLPPVLKDDDKLYVSGIRGSINVIDELNIQAELAHQFGDDAVSATSTLDYNGWGAEVIATYALPGDSMGLEGKNPTLQYVYSFTSGDDNSTDGDNDAWQPFYENQGSGTIYNAIFNLSNAHIHAVSLSSTPMEDVMAKLTWTGLWLDEKVSALTLVQPDGTDTSALSINTNKRALGHEVDLDVVYDYTEDVKIGASLGWFFPGNVFTSANDDAASQALVNAKVTF